MPWLQMRFIAFCASCSTRCSFSCAFRSSSFSSTVPLSSIRCLSSACFSCSCAFHSLPSHWAERRDSSSLIAGSSVSRLSTSSRMSSSNSSSFDLVTSARSCSSFSRSVSSWLASLVSFSAYSVSASSHACFHALAASCLVASSSTRNLVLSRRAERVFRRSSTRAMCAPVSACCVFDSCSLRCGAMAMSVGLRRGDDGGWYGARGCTGGLASHAGRPSWCQGVASKLLEGCRRRPW